MVDLGIGIFIAILILEVVLKVKVYSPSFFICSIFPNFIYSRKSSTVWTFVAKSSAYVVVIIGVLSFCAGCIAVVPFFDHIKLRDTQANLDKNYALQIDEIRRALLVLILFSLLIEFVYAIPSILYLRSGGSLYDMRYVHQDIIQRSEIVSFLHVYVALPILYIVLPISTFDFFVSGNKKYFY